MKVQRVYVDTSVIGGCFDEEFAPWSNGLMEDFRRRIFKPVLSEILAAEILLAPERVRAQYAALLVLEPEFAELTDAAQQLAERNPTSTDVSAYAFGEADLQG